MPKEIGETPAKTSEIVAVVHEKDSEAVKERNGGRIPDGVQVVSEEAYNRIALEGGFFNPVTDPGNRPALDIRSLRVASEDGKADPVRRKDAQDRIARIQKVER